MAIAEELIVALKSQGAAETKSQVNEVGESVQDVEQDVEASSDRLSGLTRKIKGFMGAIVAGVALAAGGLATQIPVLGGLFESLKSVFSAVGFQLDKRIRPALQPIIDGFYELSNAIFAGDWETVRELFNDAVNAIVNFDFAGAVNNLLSIFSDLGVTILDTLAGLDIRQILQDVYDGIAQFANRIKWAEALKPVITALGNFIDETDWLGIGADFIKALRDGIIAIYKGVDWNKWYKYIKTGLEDWVDETDFTQIAKDIVTGIGSYLKENLSFWRENFAEPIASAMVEGIEDKLESKIGMGLEVDIDNGGPGIGISTTEDTPGTFRSSNGTGMGVTMDGRRLTENTGRYDRDRTARRGVR